MADQNRWNQDRERERSRFGAQDREARGYQAYGRASDYGSDDFERGGRDREGRSFGADDEGFNTGRSYGDDNYGQGRESRYGGQWGRGEGGSQGAGYGGQGRGAYGSGYGGDYAGEGGPRGPYGRGEGSQGYGTQSYGPQSYGPQSYGQGGYGIEAGQGYGQAYGDYDGSQRTGGRGSGGQGYGGQGYRGEDRDRGERSWVERAGEKIGSWFGGEEGRHRGRGPKNYSRSDDRIREDINDRLTDDTWLDASEIEVTVTTAEVTLSGTVASRDDKRRAEDLAEQVSGVRHVQNNLRVQDQTGQAAQSGEGSSATTSATPTGHTIAVPGRNGGSSKPS